MSFFYSSIYILMISQPLSVYHRQLLQNVPVFCMPKTIWVYPSSSIEALVSLVTVLFLLFKDWDFQDQNDAEWNSGYPLMYIERPTLCLCIVLVSSLLFGLLSVPPDHFPSSFEAQLLYTHDIRTAPFFAALASFPSELSSHSVLLSATNLVIIPNGYSSHRPFFTGFASHFLDFLTFDILSINPNIVYLTRKILKITCFESVNQ